MREEELKRNNSDEDELFIEIPSEPEYPYKEKIPSGYDPMGSIYLRGRAWRKLASGKIPCWILISGWLIFGSVALLIVIVAVTLSDFTLLIPLFIPAIFVLILWRGTQAKLKSRKHR